MLKRIVFLVSWTIATVKSEVPVVETESSSRNLRGLVEENEVLLQPRIIGGQEVDPRDDRYPYFVQMWGRSLCGAALITPSIVISAAHCVNADTVASIGLKSNNDKDYDVVGIETKVVHPDYNSWEFAFDIMVMKLRSQTEKQYVRLNKEDSVPTNLEELWTIGFGDIDAGSAQVIPDVLHEVDVKYVNNSDCVAAHGANMISDDMLCAADDGKDSCAGDSGGPLVKKGSSPSEDYLVGTVAWGRGCAVERFPGVYSRVSYFYDWIVGEVCRLSPDDAPDYMNCFPSATPSMAPSGESFTPTTRMPTSTMMPTNSSMPSMAPSESPTISSAPSTNPPMIRWVGWNPQDGQLLQMCEGDCDSDAQCEGDLICFQRSQGEPIPGCAAPNSGSTARDLILDACVAP